MTPEPTPTEREKLALELFIADNFNQSREKSIADWQWFNETVSPHPPIEHYKAMAAGALSAGYRRPRTITTTLELIALPEWSVIIDHTGDAMVNRPDGWLSTEEMELYPASSIPLPVTVLHEDEMAK